MKVTFTAQLIASPKIFQINEELRAHPKVLFSFYPVIGFDLIPSHVIQFVRSKDYNPNGL